MKTYQKRTRGIALLFGLLILLQSCVAYKNAPTTLEDASKEGVRTAIEMKTKKIKHYKSIGFDNGIYYGINYRNGKENKTPLVESEINEVMVQDVKKSRTKTIVGSIVGVGIATLLIYIISDSVVGSISPGF